MTKIVNNDAYEFEKTLRSLIDNKLILKVVLKNGVVFCENKFISIMAKAHNINDVHFTDEPSQYGGMSVWDNEIDYIVI